PAGYLFLGRAELLLTHGGLFTPLELKVRVFVKVPQPDPRERLALLANAAADADPQQRQRYDRLIELALDESMTARVVIDANGALMLANQRARVLFTLNPRDIGRPFQDLEVSYRPAELRALIEQAYAEKRAVTLNGVPRHFPSGDSQYLDITATPLYDETDVPLGVAISFVDVTRLFKLQIELQRSREEIQTANEELQSSNEELETTNEELETTNEELQSTNEELETMNEELQSSNEEL